MTPSKLEDQLKRDLNGRTAAELLQVCGLPANYRKLTNKGRFNARMETLHSWYEKDNYSKLFHSQENFVKAHYLMTEFYLKPANPHVYHFRDSVHKPDMIAAIAAPPKIPTEPSKTLISATRRLGKTQTVIFEAAGHLVPLTRPHTGILLAEVNADRTSEELEKIQLSHTTNEALLEDFGGPGVSFPKRSTKLRPWNTDNLTWLNGSQLRGYSMGTSQRGRGPIWIIIDDPEHQRDCRLLSYRKTFFHTVFDVFLGMLQHSGQVFTWIGTPIWTGSCLSQAIRGKSEDQGESVARDERFDDFHRRHYSVIYRDSEGNLQSAQPERMTVEAFQIRMKTVGPASAHAEILGDPIDEGALAFPVNYNKHGFMHCQKNPEVLDGEHEYYLDLNTGLIMPWEEFFSTLRIIGGGDIADGVTPESDPGALVWLGSDHRGIRHIVDCFCGHKLSDDLVKKAYEKSQDWPQIEGFAWEKAALQTVVIRYAGRMVDDLRRQNLIAPTLMVANHRARSKLNRVLTLRVLYVDETIRHQRFLDHTTADGVHHRSVPVQDRGSHEMLYDQCGLVTDQTLPEPNDLLDALEIASRKLGERIGNEPEQIDEPEQQLKELKKIMGDVESRMDYRDWTPRMWEKHRKRREKAMASRTNRHSWVRCYDY